MLTQRKQEYQYEYVAFAPRAKELLALEGWYSFVPDNPLYLEWSKSGSKLAFSRWLLKSKKLLSDEISKICKVQPIQVKLSCRYNDFLRLSDTPHFTSCLAVNHSRSDIPKYICEDRYSALLYTPDKSGKFLGRCVIRIQNNIVRIMRPYGIYNFSIVKQFLESINLQIDEVTSYSSWSDTAVYYGRLRQEKNLHAQNNAIQSWF